MNIRGFSITLAALTLPSVILAAEPNGPTGQQVLERYDQLFARNNIQWEIAMTAHREDGSAHTYVLTNLHGTERDLLRSFFTSPPAAKGQEVLRSGDNLWVYMPNLKRTLRIGSRDDFMGGDFTNADVYRVHYSEDYTASTPKQAERADEYVTDLKSRTPNSAYDALRLWVRKSDLTPVRAQYFGTSGKLIRSSEFLNYTEFAKGYSRPAKVVIKNEIVRDRYSELVFRSVKVDVNAPPSKFLVTNLGR